MEAIVRRADILLPQTANLTHWSVIACDQYTSDPTYWEALREEIGDDPSTLNLILPEAFLETVDPDATARQIDAAMDRYLADGVFRTLPKSYVYLERTLRSGAVRRGLVGALDLEAYDYGRDSRSPVRATEGTVESRIPPRVRIRRGAALELPHILVFIDDPEDRVIGGAQARKDRLEAVYDFDLIAAGGHLSGWRLADAAADAVDAALEELASHAERAAGDAAPVIFAMGDGNHSLATAKACWEERKRKLSDAQRENDPARWALVELVNIHDAAITFEPIHRVLWTEDPAAFLREANEVFADRYCREPEGYPVVLAGPGEKLSLRLRSESIGALIGETDRFLADWMERKGGSLDYIHNDETALRMAEEGCCSILLPKLEKRELFPSIVQSGPFPRKSFSIGRAEDKRYYLECRQIRRQEA